ncbi:hypothetical protein SAMN05421821_101134 [Mucilaginibacter lappiensis]|uniref:DUF5018 domain-containing protein n=1 Tax=Mucilaginibacter lappiensis TaxID=354630 RepID=A0ABR6PDW0_9SPHI|nr:hypothetical protein [Mucilaginibacter lappiensis]MBB6107951.1 hypothetical protein [Mucilaginibacter lappiensis]SIP91433.1 hypothetical protein SAMN05421821_101134 [Mucilaginibacter lappiensis]
MIYFKSGRPGITRIFSILLVIAVLAVSSCKKEYVKYPYNEIEQFTIQDATGVSLKATILGNDIIVYYPPFQAVPDFITPQITVSDQAVVEPASGTKVAFKNSTTFKVKAQDGSVKTYTLKPMLNNPQPVFDVDPAIRVWSYVNLSGEYLVPDTSRTQLSLIDKNNKEIKISGASFTTFTATHLVANLPLSVDTGNYKIKLVTNGQAVIKGPFHIDIPYLILAIPENIKTVKRGQDLLITSADGSSKYYKNILDSKASVYNSADGKNYSFDITITDTGIRAHIPADFPLLNIQSINIFDKSGNSYGSVDRWGDGVQVTE